MQGTIQRFDCWSRKSTYCFTCGLMLSCLLAAGVAQDSSTPQASLGDIARKTRAQKQEDSAQTSPSGAQQLANELQQEQEESDNAPIGFKTFDAGIYRVYVPFPNVVEGSDNNGTAFLGSRVGVTNTEVLAGNPFPVPNYYGDINDDNVARNLVRQLSQRYGQNPGCGPTKIGEHRVFKCSLVRGRIFGHEISGTVTWVFVSQTVFPVVCVSPDDMNEHLVYGNPRATYQQQRAAYAQQSQRFRDELTTAQVCDQIVYPSIHLKEDDAHRAMTAANASEAVGKASKPAEVKGLAANPNPTAALVPSAALLQKPTASSSLGDIARQSRQNVSTHAKAKLAEDNTGAGLAPAGFTAQSFSYCKDTNCWNASFFVPANAVLLNSYYSEFVFEVPLGADKVLLYAGPAGVGGPGRNSNDPILIRWEEMNDPEGWVGRGRVRAVRHDEATVAGKLGILTHYEITKNDVVWIGARANVENHGVVVLVGCMAPQNRFADADQICSELIDSLRLP